MAKNFKNAIVATRWNNEIPLYLFKIDYILKGKITTHCQFIWVAAMALKLNRMSVTNHRKLGWMFNSLFRRRTHRSLVLLNHSAGNPPLTHRSPSQRTANREKVSMSWRHHCNIKQYLHLPNIRGNTAPVLLGYDANGYIYMELLVKHML